MLLLRKGVQKIESLCGVEILEKMFQSDLEVIQVVPQGLGSQTDCASNVWSGSRDNQRRAPKTF